MKLQNFLSNWTQSLKNFPLANCILLCLTFLEIGDINGFLDDFAMLDESIVALILMLFLSLYGPFLVIHHDKTLKKLNIWDWGLQILALILGIIYFIILVRADVNWLPEAEILPLYGIIPLSGIGLIALIAIIARKREESIRISRENLFISLCFGTFAGLVVWGGLSGAIGSIEALFDIDISWRRYSYFGAFSMIFLAGSFFLSYYLVSIENAGIAIQPSRARKIFGSYIFLPLAFIYLAIFIAYGAKILITGVWPKGIIVRLGFGYVSLGMASYFLTYSEKNTFFEILHKILFVSFLCISCLMIGAIFKRINQYGITIKRYLVCGGIAVIIISSILSLCIRNKRLLTWISTVLGISIICIYGPINAKSISFYSQGQRLSSLLKEENIALPLGENSLESLSGATAYEIGSILETLIGDYKESLRTGIIVDTNFKSEETGRGLKNDIIEDYLKLSYDRYYPYDKDKTEYQYYSNYKNTGIDISDYSVFFKIDSIDKKDKNIFEISLENHENFTLDLNPYIDDLYAKAKNKIEEGKVIIEQDNVTYYLTNYSIERTGSEIKITYFGGYLFIK